MKNLNDYMISSSISRLQNFLVNLAKCRKWILRSKGSKSKEDTRLRIVTLLVDLVREKEGGEIEEINPNLLLNKAMV